MTFTLSIEPTGEKSFQHPFHLGTIEQVARQLAEEIFHGRNQYGKPTTTVALIRERRIFDVYDGAWVSDLDFAEDTGE